MAALTPVLHREAMEAIRVEAVGHRVVPILEVAVGTKPAEELVVATRAIPAIVIARAECIAVALHCTQDH